MEYPDANASSGMLTLRIRGTTSLTQDRQIGLVQRVCWDQVKSYIERKIVSQGTIVHISEIVADRE